MKILITGISSPLAQFTAKQLLTKGHSVVGFARTIAHLELPEVILHQCSLSEIARLNLLASDVEIIVHIAALSSPWGKKKEFYRSNVEGTKNIINAAQQGSCRRLIHISTPSIYFSYKDHLSIKEDTIIKRPANTYIATKRQAEILIEEAEQKGLETITLRPRALFGPGDRTLLPRLLQAVEKGGVPKFRKRGVLVDVTYVENAADAIVKAIEAPSSCSGNKYNITNGTPIDLHSLFQLLLTKLGYPYKERRISFQIAKKMSWLAVKYSHLTGKEPLFTPYTVGVLTFSQTLSIEKAKTELNYAPKITLSEGIDRYVDWWKTK